MKQAEQVERQEGRPTERGGSACEFRWDVEIPLEPWEGVSGYGQRFMKQWRKVLTVQKMAPLVSKAIAPLRARYQLCVSGGAAGEAVAAREKEIARALSRLSWGEGSGSETRIAGEPAGEHPAGWQGVRLWVEFAREDIERTLGKKPKI